MRKVVLVLEMTAEEAVELRGVLEVGSDDGEESELAHMVASNIERAMDEKPEGDVGVRIISASTIPGCQPGTGAVMTQDFDPADYEDEETHEEPSRHFVLDPEAD